MPWLGAATRRWSQRHGKTRWPVNAADMTSADSRSILGVGLNITDPDRGEWVPCLSLACARSCFNAKSKH